MVFIATLALLAVASCGGGDVDNVVTGFIVDVVPSGIDSFSSLIVRDDNGKVWRFGAGRFPHFTPSHLIEHQIAGDRVKVTYGEPDSDGLLTILEMDDG